MTTTATTLEDSASQIWDVIVVGAGPAGGLAAYLLAKQNLKVLLVERQKFPRHKVCGCCLNGNAIAALEASGLSSILVNNHAVALDQMCLSSGKISQSFPLHKQMVLSRERFDASLVEEATKVGAHFLDDTTAEMGSQLEPFRDVHLQKGNSQGFAKAKTVIAADGLGNRLLVRTKITNYLAGRKSRIGAGVTIENPPDFYRPGKLFMACGKGGYLGLVCLEDGRLDLAAAFDPGAIKKHGSMGLLAKALIADSGWPIPQNLEVAPWRGTARLTGQIGRISAHRLFVIGDAAGYVEPFTGEGMAWALTGATLVLPLVAQAVASWRDEIATQWQEMFQIHIRKRQGICKMAAAGLRWPWLVRSAILTLKVFPFLSSPFVALLDKPGKAVTDS